MVSTFCYSFAGGYADATGFMVAGSFTGHITGNLVLLITSAASGHTLAMLKPLVALAAFLLATVIGIIAQKSRVRLVHWIVLLFQCLLLCTIVLDGVRLSHWFTWALLVVLALCLGVQNGYTGVADGVVVHVSYMTGTVTRLTKAVITLTRGRRGTDQAGAGIAAIISCSVLVGFVTGALSAVAAQRASTTYAPLFLCLPLILATLASHPANIARISNLPVTQAQTARQEK
ncbi:DUF1275 family protein [Terriglobus roseus]|nr:YoaK family protein [Terriglobus roseus]